MRLSASRRAPWLTASALGLLLQAAGPAAAQFTLEHVTITDNVALGEVGGLLLVTGNGIDPTAILENTLIAGNTAPEAPDCGLFDGFADAASQGVNLLGIDAGGTLALACPTAMADLVGTAGSPLDPLVGALADNGGETPTHALLLGSPAIDAAPDQGEAQDQRTFARPQGSAFDIGAFEAVATDLAITKTDSVDPAFLGTVFTYVVRVENLGPAAATDVVVVDELPAELAFQVATPSGGSCVSPAVGEMGGTLTCTFAGVTAVSDMLTIEIDVLVPLTATPGSTVVNTATVSSSTPEIEDGAVVRGPAPAPNVAVQTTTLANALLSITKTDSADPVQPGDPLSYVLTAENLGPDVAVDLTIADVLPAELAFQAATPSAGGVCTTPMVGALGGMVDCTFAGDTAVNAQRSVTIDVTVPMGAAFGAVVNQASASSVTNPSAVAVTSESTQIGAIDSIPTLAELGLLLLGLALAGVGVLAISRVG